MHGSELMWSVVQRWYVGRQAGGRGRMYNMEHVLLCSSRPILIARPGAAPSPLLEVAKGHAVRVLVPRFSCELIDQQSRLACAAMPACMSGVCCAYKQATCTLAMLAGWQQHRQRTLPASIASCISSSLSGAA